jgi:glucose-1-phosphate adenylyltransferase
MPQRTVLTVIMAGGKGERLDPLTRHRTKPAVPFGGIYRIIDFTLSNCINSGLRRVLVLVQHKCMSLMRHLHEGWSFLPASLGEYVEPIPPQQRVGDTWYLGTADSVYQNIYSIEKENPRHVLVLAGDHIYKMNYNKMLNFHLEKKAGVTVAAFEIPKQDAAHFGIIQTDAESRITGFQEKPKENPATMPGTPDSCLASMGIYVFETELLYRVLGEDAVDKNSSHDFGKNIIPKLLAEGKHPVCAFRFIDENKKAATYWRDVGTIDAYFSASMELAGVSPVLNLYDTEWPMRTAAMQLPPPKFVFAQEYPGGRLGIALDSMISPGCIISGGRVQGSVLSPNVRINSYSQVLDSILFENVVVGRYSKIRRAVIDKDVNIPEGREIGYNLEEDRKRFTVTDSGIVVISKGETL